MILQKYVCPNCGDSKTPVKHYQCGGIVLKIGNQWVCNSCFRQMGESTVCSSCNEEFSGNVFEMETKLY